VGLDSGDHICYNLRKEVVKMKEKTIDRRALPKCLGITLLAVVFLTAGFGTRDACYTQQDCITPYLESLTEAPAIASLGEAMAKVDADEGERAQFMNDPRAYLATTHNITVPADKFQMTALNLDVGFDKKVFGRAELRGQGIPSVVGIGVFFSKVGLIVQPAVARDAPTGASLEQYLTLLTLIPEASLCGLYRVMSELQETDKDSDERKRFLENPRQFLLDKGIRLSSDQYRLVALDFEKAKAEETGAFKVSELSDERTKLTPSPEGIGLIYEHVGLFLQKAV
jgi:hypothetical protein